MSSKLRGIQALRGIAVVMVVILHCYAFEEKAGVGARWLPSWVVFGSSGVDLFFVVSGFITVFTTSDFQPGVGSFRN